MPKKTSTGKVQVTPNVTMSVDLSSDDVVNIHIACKEDELLKQEEQLQAELQTVQEDLTEISKVVQDLAQEYAEKSIDGQYIGLITLLENNTKLTGKLGVSIHIKPKGELNIRPTLHLSSPKDRYSEHSIQLNDINMRLPDAVADMCKKQEELQARSKALSTEIIKVKTSLANIDRLERRAKANLAVMALESTDAGRKMLADIRTAGTRALLEVKK